MASRTTPRAAPERLGRVVARSSASRGALSTRARGSARPRARAATLRVSAIGKLFGGIGSDDDSESNVFAAKKRSAVRIPGLVVDVTPAEVSDENAMRALEEVVRRGATAVILSDAEDAASTRALFDAGLTLKERLRGRAALFVADRTDIAASVEADGVVLGDDGVPVVVARRSMPGPAVVARAVGDEKAALVAAKEGADLILVRGGSSSASGDTENDERRSASDVVSAIFGASKISVPVFASLEANGLGDAAAVDALVAAGARGFALSSAPRDPDAAGDGAKRALDAVAAVLKTDDGSRSAAGDVEAAKANRAVETEASSASSASSAAPTGLAGKLIDGASLALLERERALLDEAVSFLRSGAPELEEIDLLVEARKGLEELFLLVIVGEFNAGKSSVINAVLGERFLKEGILPTTNEITVLKYGASNEVKQSTDGFYTQTVPAELLKEVNIVDTPGTNVILERQQRLTEEFVPRADLVLFVLSADRPMTESEVKFLTYIKKWGKKVVFVVNKCDRLENEGEVREVATFVADNAERLLGVTDAAVMPVSAKAALAAKRTGAPLENTGFTELEDYVLSFLGGGGGGGGSRGGEGMRLKLNTPLQVSEQLFAAAEEILAAERRAAGEETKAATGVGDAMEAYADAMSEDFGAQLDAVRQCVLRSVARCDDVLDSTLRLTNAAELFTSYVLGNGGGAVQRAYAAAVLGDARAELRAALAEHTGWLKRNNTNQLAAYEDAVRARGFDPEETDLGLAAVIAAEPAEEDGEAGEARASRRGPDDAEDGETNGDAAAAEEDGEAISDPSRTAASLAEIADEGGTMSASDLVRRRYSAADETSALAVAAGFDHGAAAALLEEEVKSAVYATVGAAGGAFFVAVFLSGFLDSLAEDVLAFSLTAAVGYVSVLSLPLKRAETKAKVRAAAEDFLAETEKAMRAEFERKTLAATRQVLATTAPWSRAAVETENEIAANQARRDALQEALDALRRDVQSL